MSSREHTEIVGAKAYVKRMLFRGKCAKHKHRELRTRSENDSARFSTYILRSITELREIVGHRTVYTLMTFWVCCYPIFWTHWENHVCFLALLKTNHTCVIFLINCGPCSPIGLEKGTRSDLIGARSKWGWGQGKGSRGEWVGGSGSGEREGGRKAINLSRRTVKYIKTQFKK